MLGNITIDNIIMVLASTVLPDKPNDDDMFALMVLFHTHNILLKHAVLADRPGIFKVMAATQREVATMAADVWPDRSDSVRVKPFYWYFNYNIKTPYETIYDIDPSLNKVIQHYIAQIAQVPYVDKIVPDTDS